jgi:hypothetical protein
MDVKFCTILITKTDSSVVDLEDCDLLGLILPTLDNASLTFKVCDTAGGTFVTVKDKDATTALTIAASVGAFAVASNILDGLKGYRYVQISASAAQNTAARIFTWQLKKNWRR